MQIILLDRARLRTRSIRCGRHAPLLVGVVCGALLGSLMFYLGMAYEHGGTASVLMGLAQRTSGELHQQQQEVVELRRQLGHHLDALALRVGRLQAHGMRLDALGERLTGLAGLEQAEFDFRNPPPLGGPSTETLRATGVPDIEQALAELAASLAARETQLRFVESYLRDSGLAERALPSGRPVEEGWISSRFGQRIDPLNGRSTLHEGIDFAGKAGSEVRAVAAGLVTWSGRYAGYGELVELDHGNGYVTRYAHNRENLVAVGARVDKGQPIARLGSTGRSTGPHVHFEVLHEGRPVNPERYVRASR